MNAAIFANKPLKENEPSRADGATMDSLVISDRIGLVFCTHSQKQLTFVLSEVAVLLIAQI